MFLFKKLNDIREKNGISRKKLCEIAEVNVATWTRLQKKPTQCTLATLSKLNVALVKMIEERAKNV